MWERASLIISGLLIYNMVFDAIKYTKTYPKNRSNNNADDSTIADWLILIFLSLVVLTIVIIIVWTHIVPPIFTIIIILLPYSQMHLSSAIIASGAVKDIVFEKNARKELTLDEKFKCDTMVGGILVLGSIYPPNRIIQAIVRAKFSGFVSSAMVSLYCLVVVFIILFIFVILMINPFRHLGILLVFLKKRLARYSGNIRLIVYKPIEKGVCDARLTKRFIECLKTKRLFVSVVLGITLPLLFLLDFFRSLFLFVYSYIFIFCLGTIVFLLKCILTPLIKIVVSIGGTYSHKVIKDSFRLATIVSVIFVVVANRLSFFCVLDETFIEIWEFISSGILIPVILEWIYSSKQERESMGAEL